MEENASISSSRHVMNCCTWDNDQWNQSGIRRCDRAWSKQEERKLYAREVVYMENGQVVFPDKITSQRPSHTQKASEVFQLIRCTIAVDMFPFAFSMHNRINVQYKKNKPGAQKDKTWLKCSQNRVSSKDPEKLGKNICPLQSGVCFSLRWTH